MQGEGKAPNGGKVMTSSRRSSRNVAALVFLAGFVFAASVGYVSGRMAEGTNPLRVMGQGADDAGEFRLGRTAAANYGRQAVTRELIESRLTLPEAIDRFAALTIHNPDSSRRVFREAYAGATDHERFGHQVIAYVASMRGDQSDESPDLVARLEAQLAALVGQNVASPGAH
jgi:hypothetical protein